MASKKGLRKYATAELFAEIQRRECENSGHGWYFCEYHDDEDDEDDEENRQTKFSFCSIRYFHERGCFYDAHVERMLKLPNKFYECNPSVFSFEGTIAEGRKLLLDLGFTEFSFCGNDLYHVLKFKNVPTDKNFRWNYRCDTDKIYNQLLRATKAHEAFQVATGPAQFESFEAYQTLMAGLMKPSWKVLVKREYAFEGSVTIIKDKTWRNLPPCPLHLELEKS
jgi:hypothetical protein